MDAHPFRPWVRPARGWPGAMRLNRDLIDQPGERRSHAVSTPRGGGIAIVVALLVACGALAIRLPGQTGALAAFGSRTGAGGGGRAGWTITGRLLPGLRLGVHALAAAVFAAAIQYAYADPWLAGAAFVLAIVLVNVWNFMDGINGLAATQAALVSLALAAVTEWSLGLEWRWLWRLPAWAFFPSIFHGRHLSGGRRQRCPGVRLGGDHHHGHCHPVDRMAPAAAAAVGIPDRCRTDPAEAHAAWRTLVDRARPARLSGLGAGRGNARKSDIRLHGVDIAFGGLNARFAGWLHHLLHAVWRDGVVYVGRFYMVAAASCGSAARIARNTEGLVKE